MNETDKKNQKRYRRKLRLRTLEALGGKCVQCGFEDWRALQIDHINSGGSQDTYTNPIKPQHDIVAGRNLENYQLLCANCNMIKRYTSKEIVDDNYEPSSSNGEDSGLSHRKSGVSTP